MEHNTSLMTCNFLLSSSSSLSLHAKLLSLSRERAKIKTCFQTPPLSLSLSPAMEPKGTIVFTTVGRPEYGFDIFSLQLPSILPSSPTSHLDHILEHRLTDGISVNYNGSFAAAANNDAPTLVYVSERSGSSRIYLNRGGGTTQPEVLPSATASLFHDSPIIDGNARRLYFISAHEPPEVPFKSWSALYSVTLDSSKGCNIPSRLTPYGCVDYSPALSQSGKLIAVASYGSRPWPGEFNDLQTDVVVFPETDPTNRTVVCQHGGWPTWSGDSTIYFHRQADDGWCNFYMECLGTPTTECPHYT